MGCVGSLYSVCETIGCAIAVAAAFNSPADAYPYFSWGSMLRRIIKYPIYLFQASIAFAKRIVAFVRDWAYSLFRPAIVLQRLSASLFGPYGKLALYERLRIERLSFDGPPALRLAI